MQELKKIKTSILLVMVAAHSSDYGRILTVDEANDCRITIKELQEEIASRKDATNT
jgi:hypothetical protein